MLPTWSRNTPIRTFVNKMGREVQDPLALKDEIERELRQDAAAEFNHEEFLTGKQTPMLLDSAVNNFGVQEILDALVELAPAPGERAAMQRVVKPEEPKFTGLVFLKRLEGSRSVRPSAHLPPKSSKRQHRPCCFFHTPSARQSHQAAARGQSFGRKRDASHDGPPEPFVHRDGDGQGLLNNSFCRASIAPPHPKGFV